MKPSILIIGDSKEIIPTTASLFQRSGFHVDCISSSIFVGKNSDLNNFFYCKNPSEIPEFSYRVFLKKKYLKVIISDDPTIALILDSSLTQNQKIDLLPISDIAHKEHLFSKIGLSIALSNSTVPTPKYTVVKSPNDLANSKLNLSFPIIIKGDRSSSGAQTFRFNSQKELSQFKFESSFYPAIVQEFIFGQLITIEAFFHQKDLNFFQYSEVIRNVQNSEFTPSNLRRFFHTSNLNQEVEENLAELGRTLGADGFINIGCILSNDNKLSFFEADMRPNVWIDYGKFWGEDASEKISRKFSTLNINFSFPQKFDNEKIILGCPHRLPLIDIFLNRYKSCFVLKHHTFELHLLLRKFRHFLFSIINLRFLRSFFKKLSFFNRHLTRQ
jgi:hypothetical protein